MEKKITCGLCLAVLVVHNKSIEMKRIPADTPTPILTHCEFCKGTGIQPQRRMTQTRRSEWSGLEWMQNEYDQCSLETEIKYHRPSLYDGEF